MGAGLPEVGPGLSGDDETQLDGKGRVFAGLLAQYQQAEQILVKEVAWIPLFQQAYWWEVKPYVRNYFVDAGNIVPKESWQAIVITAH